MSARDVRDTCLEQLADENAALREACDFWHAFALALLERLSEQSRELQMIDRREHVYRARTQEARDVFLDQRDLRLTAQERAA